jgi:hypothetical protein
MHGLGWEVKNQRKGVSKEWQSGGIFIIINIAFSESERKT